MVKINGTKIEMTRGDTCVIELTLQDANGDEYIPNNDDVIRFALKRHYGDKDVRIYKVIPNDTLTLTIDPSDTKPLSFGSYVYDIQITYADGKVDTFIDRATLVLTEEVD